MFTRIAAKNYARENLQQQQQHLSWLFSPSRLWIKSRWGGGRGRERQNAFSRRRHFPPFISLAVGCCCTFPSLPAVLPQKKGTISIFTLRFCIWEAVWFHDHRQQFSSVLGDLLTFHVQFHQSATHARTRVKPSENRPLLRSQIRKRINEKSKPDRRDDFRRGKLGSIARGFFVSGKLEEILL